MNIDPTIFKAYDIRGVYPTQINEEIAYAIGQAYAKFANPKKVALGRDVRLSSPALWEAMKNGLIDHGVDVIDIGVVSTDMMYFAVASYRLDGGLTITGSHNPKEYNGVKMVRKKGIPISGDSGIMDIRDLVVADYKFEADTKGSIEKMAIADDYLSKVMSVVDVKKIKPFRVVANTNFGTTGLILQKIAAMLPITLTVLNGEPNGEFPKGRPDPLIPENRNETIAEVQKEGADLGVMWDSDADRCFFIDERGRFLSGYYTSAVLAEYFLRKYPKSKIVCDMKLNRAIIDTIKSNGGIPLENKTGHSFFKERMIHEDGVFGGEVSGHYFFKDYFYMDNGLIPFLIILELMSTTNRKLSDIYEPLFVKYFAIDETNVTVGDVNAVIQRLQEKYADANLSYVDGISIEYDAWRANVRPSNTEPLVRLNLEASDPEILKQKNQELLELIKQ
jgi:phosphomannomutase